MPPVGQTHAFSSRSPDYEVDYAQYSSDQSMNGSEEQELHEVLYVAHAYACSNPAAVMVVHFYAHVAISAVEGAWWSYNPAGTALQ